jgi:hypothetical protein
MVFWQDILADKEIYQSLSVPDIVESKILTGMEGWIGAQVKEIIPEVNYHTKVGSFLGKIKTRTDRSQQVFGGKYKKYVTKHLKKLKKTNFSRMLEIYQHVVTADVISELTIRNHDIFARVDQAYDFLSQERLQTYVGQLTGNSAEYYRSTMRSITPTQLMKLYSLAYARMFWKKYSSKPELLSEWLSDFASKSEFHRVQFVEAEFEGLVRDFLSSDTVEWEYMPWEMLKPMMFDNMELPKLMSGYGMLTEFQTRMPNLNREQVQSVYKAFCVNKKATEQTAKRLKRNLRRRQDRNVIGVEQQ